MSLTGGASNINPIDHYRYTILHYANSEATSVYMRSPRPKDLLVSIGGYSGTRKIHLASWDIVTTPKKEGG